MPAVEPVDREPSPHLTQGPIASPVIDTALFATDDFTFLSPNLSDSVLEDGIFLPGSHFQELHAQLRSRIFDTARSAFPSRFGTPEIFPEPASELPLEDDEESRRLAHLSPEQEYRLWDNYINEVASWVDKFDSGKTDSLPKNTYLLANFSGQNDTGSSSSPYSPNRIRTSNTPSSPYQPAKWSAKRRNSTSPAV